VFPLAKLATVVAKLCPIWNVEECRDNAALDALAGLPGRLEMSGDIFFEIDRLRETLSLSVLAIVSSNWSRSGRVSCSLSLSEVPLPINKG
jgi:hypothetical protein